VGLNEVISQVTSRNKNIPGGELLIEGENSLVRVEGKVRSVEELKNVVIRSNFSGKKIYLKDVAEVVDGKNKLDVKARFNGEEASLLVVTKKAGADTLALVDDVEKVLRRYRKDAGSKFKISTYNNEAKKVKNKLDILISNAVTGLVLVVFFLLVFLPGAIGIVASLSLPLAVMATLGLMPSFGMNLDAITILALVIALGMLVDNSVVISENFTRLKLEGQSSLDASLNSAKQLFLPITATAFTTIFAFLPMLMTKGIMGEFIRFIPIVVSLALLLSLIESFFLLPMRLNFVGRFVKPVDQSKKKPWFERIISSFEKLMKLCVKWRYLMMCGYLILMLGSFLLMFVFNKFILFPADQTEIYLARTQLKIGTTLKENDLLIQKLSRKIKKKLGDKAEFLVARAGISQGGGPNDPKARDGDHVGLVIIYVSEETKINTPYTEVLKKLRTIDTSDFKEVEFEEMVNGPPVGGAINATFRSNNSKSLHELLSKVKGDLEKLKGITSLETDEVIGEDEVFVDIDYAKIDQINLNVQDIGNIIRTSLAGGPISDVTLNNKDIDLHLRLNEESRDELSDLNTLKVMDKLGNLVPLSRFATLRKSKGSTVIKRFDFKRSITLLGSVDDVNLTSMTANQKLRESFEKHSPDHLDVSLIFGGAEESTKESFESLLMALVLALIAIYAIMVFLFRSFLRPAIIMSTIPLGLVGFSIAFYIHQRPVSFLAMIGLIGLAGIIVNSGIVLISFIDEMRKEGELDLHVILAKSSGLRLRAVIVTSLTTISGLLPTAYGVGGNEAMLIPMTLAMAWGLTSGTILTLVWIPCAYAILEDWLNFFYKFINRFFKTNLEVFGNE